VACLVVILLAVALSWNSRPANSVALSCRMTLGFGYHQSHFLLKAFHERAAVGALGWARGSLPSSGRDTLRSWRLSSTRLVTGSMQVSV